MVADICVHFILYIYKNDKLQIHCHRRQPVSVCSRTLLLGCFPIKANTMRASSDRINGPKLK